MKPNGTGGYWGVAPLVVGAGVVAAAAKPSSNAARRGCFVRLIFGSMFNFLLVVLTLNLGAPAWGEWERPYYFNFIAGSVAAVTLVIVAPAIWRGTSLEVILALFFAAAPIYTLFRVYDFWQGIR